MGVESFEFFAGFGWGLAVGVIGLVLLVTVMGNDEPME